MSEALDRINAKAEQAKDRLEEQGPPKKLPHSTPWEDATHRRDYGRHSY